MPNNTLLTVDQITRKALMILHAKMSFLANINKQYDSSFAETGAKIGDTLRIRLPNEYTVRSGMTMATQDVTETNTSLKVDTVKGVDLNFTSLDLTLSLDDFADRILEPAMSVLAANVEGDVIATLYKDVPNIVDGDAAAFAFTHLSSARQALTEALAPPAKRVVVMTPTHATKYMNDTKGLFHERDVLEKQYVEGVIGRTQGFSIFENTLLGSHTTGTAAKTTGYVVNGASQSGASITVSTGTTTFLKGDIITFAGCNEIHPETKVSLGRLKTFVITADSGASATSLAISPAIVTSGGRQNVSGSPTNGGAVVKVGAGANELLTNTLAYYRDAFTFATADLVMPKGVDFASRQVFDGISMSIIRDFTIADRSFPCRVDVLYGKKTLRPTLACRIHADG